MLRKTLKVVVPKSILSRLLIFKQTVTWRLFRLVPSSRLSPIQRYERDGRNNLLVDGLHIDADSFVWDFGGFVGDYTAAILERYTCNVLIFEPVPTFAQICQDRFLGNDSVTINPYAVGRVSGERTFHVAGDMSGLFAGGSPNQVNFVSAQSVAKEFSHMISVMKVNIEGGEFELIPALAEAGILQSIGTILIQFHKVGNDSDAQKAKCTDLLDCTHVLEWEYPWVWEKWINKNLI